MQLIKICKTIAVNPSKVSYVHQDAESVYVYLDDCVIGWESMYTFEETIKVLAKEGTQMIIQKTVKASLTKTVGIDSLPEVAKKLDAVIDFLTSFKFVVAMEDKNDNTNA